MSQDTIQIRDGRDLLPADRDLRSEPIPFDRRRAKRETCEGTFMASFFSDEAGITLARVSLRDTSKGGASLRSPLEIAPGARFCLYREGHAIADQRGTVARCAQAKDQFILGLRFDAAGSVAA
jgi:hypothetical protein